MKIRQLAPYTIAVGSMALVIFLLLLTVVLQQFTSSNLSSEIRSQSENLDRYKRETANYRKTTTDYGNMSANLGGRYKEVTWTSRMPYVVSDLTGITQYHHMKIQTLKPEPITQSDSVYRLPMRITVQSHLADLARLAQDVEDSVPFMDIERMDIHMASDKSDALQCDMTISSFAVQDDKASQPAVSIATEKPKDKKSPKQVSKEDSHHGGAI